MYCKECGSNNAYPGRDINLRQDILICPDCKCVTWPPVKSTEDLSKDVELIKERIKEWNVWRVEND